MLWNGKVEIKTKKQKSQIQKRQRTTSFWKTSIRKGTTKASGETVGAKALGFICSSALVQVACSSWFLSQEHGELQFLLEEQNISVIKQIWRGKETNSNLYGKEGKDKLWRIRKILELGEKRTLGTAFLYEIQRGRWIIMCEEGKGTQKFAVEKCGSRETRGAWGRLELVNTKL